MEYVKNAFEVNDIMRVVNAGTTLPAITAAAPIISVNPVNGPEGAPYSSGDIFIRITPN
jgi:hypothetical protein